MFLAVSFLLVTVVIGNPFISIESFYKSPLSVDPDCWTSECAEVGGRTESEIDQCLNSIPSSCEYISEQKITRSWLIDDVCMNSKPSLSASSTGGLIGFKFDDMKLYGDGFADSFLEFSWTIIDQNSDTKALPERCSYLVFRFPLGDVERRHGDLERRDGGVERRDGGVERRDGDVERRDVEVGDRRLLSSSSSCNLPLFHSPGKPYPAGTMTVSKNILHVKQSAALNLLNHPKVHSNDWIWFSDTQARGDKIACLQSLKSADFNAIVMVKHTGRKQPTRRKSSSTDKAVLVPSIAAVSLSAVFMGK